MDPTKYRIIDEEEQEPLSPAPTQEFATRAVPKLLSEQSETTEYQSTQKKETEIHPVKRQISYPAGEELTDEIDRIYELRRGNADKCPVCYSQNNFKEIQRDKVEVSKNINPPLYEKIYTPDRFDGKYEFYIENKLNNNQNLQYFNDSILSTTLRTNVQYIIDKDDKCCLKIRVEICCRKLPYPCTCDDIRVSLETRKKGQVYFSQELPWIKLGEIPDKYRNVACWQRESDLGVYCIVLLYKLCHGGTVEEFRVKIGRVQCVPKTVHVPVSNNPATGVVQDYIRNGMDGYKKHDIQPWNLPYDPKSKIQSAFVEGVSMFTKQLTPLESSCCACEYVDENGYLKGDWLKIKKTEVNNEYCYEFLFRKAPDDFKKCFDKYYIRLYKNNNKIFEGSFDLSENFIYCLKEGERLDYQITFHTFYPNGCWASGSICAHSKEPKPCFYGYRFKFETNEKTFSFGYPPCFITVKYAFQTSEFTIQNRHFSIYEITIHNNCNIDIKEIFKKAVAVVIDEMQEIYSFDIDRFNKWELMIWNCWEEVCDGYWIPCITENIEKPCNKYYFEVRYNRIKKGTDKYGKTIWDWKDGENWRCDDGEINYASNIDNCEEPCAFESRIWMEDLVVKDLG